MSRTLISRRSFLVSGSSITTFAMSRLTFPQVNGTLHTGKRIQLSSDLLAGKLTIVQFIFTNCPTSCPLLARIYRNVIPDFVPAQYPKLQFLSISVDPRRDNPAALAAWLNKQKAPAHWKAVHLDERELNIVALRLGESAGSPALHSTTIRAIGGNLQLCGQVTGLPRANQVSALIHEVYPRA